MGLAQEGPYLSILSSLCQYCHPNLIHCDHRYLGLKVVAEAETVAQSRAESSLLSPWLQRKALEEAVAAKGHKVSWHFHLSQLLHLAGLWDKHTGGALL